MGHEREFNRAVRRSPLAPEADLLAAARKVSLGP